MYALQTEEKLFLWYSPRLFKLSTPTTLQRVGYGTKLLPTPEPSSFKSSSTIYFPRSMKFLLFNEAIISPLFGRKNIAPATWHSGGVSGKTYAVQMPSSGIHQSCFVMKESYSGIGESPLVPDCHTGTTGTWRRRYNADQLFPTDRRK